MTDVDSTPNEPLDEDARSPPLDYALVENEDAPDECLLFPRAATETELGTQWLLASEDGFVPIESMR